MAARKSTRKKSTTRRASPAKKSTTRRASPAKKSTTKRPAGTRRSSRAHVNPVEIVRRGYQALATGDVPWLEEHLSDDIVWHVPGQNPLSADYRGKQEVLAFFGLTMKVTGSTFRIELHDVVGNDDHVVAIGTQFAHGPEGEFLEGRFAQVFHIRDEKATEVWTHPEDSAAVDDFFTRIISEEIVLIPDLVVVEEDVTIVPS